MHVVALPRHPYGGATSGRRTPRADWSPCWAPTLSSMPRRSTLQILPSLASAHHAPYTVGKDVVGLVFSCHFVELFSAERIALINAVLEGAGAGAAAITTPAITL